MSKTTSSKVASFKYHTTTKLPKLKKVKTKWNLAGHYYKSENDPQIEKAELHKEVLY